MARDEKALLLDNGIDRRETGYYSTPDFVAEYIFERLTELAPNAKSILDPCIGAEELTQRFTERGLSVDGFDILKITSDYSSNFVQCDFLEFIATCGSNDLFGKKELKYDLYVLNPPYNCHEVDYIRRNKTRLKVQFPQTGVHNMYSMFFDAVISVAKEGAFIGIITLDSFLTAKYHAALRDKIRKNCKIHDLLLCPTSLFRNQGADVRTCIMILEKTAPPSSYDLNTLQRPKSIEGLKRSLQNRIFDRPGTDDIVLDNHGDNAEFIVGAPREIVSLFRLQRIGERYSCVTGISTGNDKKFLSRETKHGFTVPFYKNPGSRKFYCPVQYYLIDDYLTEPDRTKNFMVRNKRFIGKEGITCSSMGVKFSACYLPAGSTFGVNANIFPEEDLWWLLSYLNSSLVQYLLRGVLIRSNMVTSGYVARLPVPSMTGDSRNCLENIARENWEDKGRHASQSIGVVNEIVYRETMLSPETQSMIADFEQEIYRRT